MADPPLYGDSGEHTGTPRWVKIFGLIAVVLIVLVAVALLTGGGPGDHGPGRHARGGDAGGQTPPSNVTKSGGDGVHTAPAGGHGPR